MITMFLPYKSIGIFSKHSRAAISTIRVSILLKFKLIPAYMVVLITCTKEENPIKNEGARVVTRLYVIFISDIQGQATPSTMLRSGRNSDSFEHLYIPLLHAAMRKIQSKMKAPEWPQHIFHCKSIGIFPDAQGQLTPQSIIGSVQNSNSAVTLCLSSLPARMKKIQ